jgi:hypothetical protein
MSLSPPLFPVRVVALLGLLVACNGGAKENENQGQVEGGDEGTDGSDGSDGGGGADGGTTERGTLSLVLDSASTQAGIPVGYEVLLTMPDGEELRFDPLPASDAGPVAGTTASELILTTAAEHNLSVTLDYLGESYNAEASLTVTAGPLYDLDLQLSTLALPAGETASWEVLGWDAYDNVVDTAGLLPSAEPSELIVGPGTWSGQIAGAYSLSVEGSGADGALVSDSENLLILAGTPERVELSLRDPEVELYETTALVVDIYDAYDNLVNLPSTISVSGTGVEADDYTLSYRNITFMEEGAYDLRVDVDGTSLFDEIGPILVDSSGPLINLGSPERGSWVSGTSSTVSGAVSDAVSPVDSLTIQGTAVTFASDGSFSTAVTWEEGINLLESEAVDADGNTSTDTRAVLAGNFNPWGDPVDSGFVIRLRDAATGLGALETLAEDLVTPAMLTSAIPNPVFTDSQTQCFPGIGCVTWYSITLRVRNPNFSSTALDLDAQSGGVLQATFTVNDLYLEWTASGKAAGVNYTGSGTITADDLTIEVDMIPSVDSSGQIQLAVSSVVADSTNFSFNVSGTTQTVLTALGLSGTISSLIEGYVLDTLETTVESEVPPLVEDALQGLEIAYSLPMGGQDYAIEASPQSIAVDASGITLGLETTVSPETWTKDTTGLGSLILEDEITSWSLLRGTWLAVNLDFLNQALMAFWGGGMLDMTLSGESLGLDPADLALLFPGITEINVTTEAMLPPVAVPDGVDAQMELQIGDLLLTLYGGPVAPGNELIQVYMSVFSEMDMASNADATALTISLGDNAIAFDVVIPSSGTVGARDTEALLELLVPYLLPFLTDALSEIPIPEIAGFTLASPRVDMLGAEDGFVGVGANLSPL